MNVVWCLCTSVEGRFWLGETLRARTIRATNIRIEFGEEGFPEKLLSDCDKLRSMGGNEFHAEMRKSVEIELLFISIELDRRLNYRFVEGTRPGVVLRCV